MRILNLKSILTACILTGISFTGIQAQEGSINLTQDQKIETLLELKAEMTKNNEIGDRYKIQLFYGDNGKANEVIKEYRSKYSYPSLIAYEAPNYKVWVGNFRNRLEADRALLEIKETFPSAFIPKPRR
ncbi:MAG: SPOR domain-containing protein [Salegentibacter sp.]|uniref:Sporulation related domain-containing protein n=1 Tax=Salegentibacter flavus TaxID=287099 RepID=A0A1I4XMB3_9FLAO|nr:MULTISPECIES: SPOR domain-containing protein [Salegentibacter]MDR9456022.1 SPOR domain-containing protein [Salegentibacter sp.]SFN26776.1 Sporulation related domain-containing protein [Salegentibacter flavus]